jgi:hypothetical protein
MRCLLILLLNLLHCSFIPLQLGVCFISGIDDGLAWLSLERETWPIGSLILEREKKRLIQQWREQVFRQNPFAGPFENFATNFFLADTFAITLLGSTRLYT